MQNILKRKWVAMLAAVLCTVLWGSAYPVIKYGYGVLHITSIADKLMFAGVRFVLAGLMVFVFTWCKNRRVPTVPGERVGGVLLYGFLQTGLMYILNYIGVANTTATKTSIITAASAFFAVLFAPLFFKGERLTVWKVVGVLIGMTGIFLVNNTALDGFSFMGEGLVLISMLLNTAGSFVGKRVSKGIVYESTAYQLSFGGLVILLIALFMGGRFPLTWQSVGIVLFLAFVSAAAFTLWTALLVLHEAGQILVFNMLIPVTGALWSFIILGEDQILEPLYIVSIILTAVGIVLVNRPTKTSE
ncbi:DMT family transporter [Ruminococcus sp.]|uniref:DMT family transporter n=1 Tax=Ruminococcus sp. TaxID=41978 RepID=UPI0038674201